MPKNIGDLAVRITADAAKFTSGLNKAKRDTDDFTTKMKRGFADATKATAALTAGFVAVTGAVGYAVKSALNYADAIGKAADQSGVSTKRIQEMRYAFGFFNISVEQSDKALQDFNRKLGELQATGSGDAKATFDALGIAVRDAAGNLRSTEDVLDEAYDKLGRIESPAQRAALAMKLFGEEAGPKIANALKQGSEEIVRLRDEAHKLGLVLSDETIRSAEQVNDQLSQMAQVMQMQLLQALEPLMPLIKDFVNSLGDPETRSDIQAMVGTLIDLSHTVIDVAGSMARGFQISKNYWAYLTGDMSNLEAVQRSLADTYEFIEKVNKMQDGPRKDELLEQARAKAKELLNTLADLQKKAQAPIVIEIKNGLEDTGGSKGGNKNNPFTPKAINDTTKALDALAKKWKEAHDPARKYREELELVNQAEAAGKLTAEEAAYARAELWNKMIEPLELAKEKQDDLNDSLEKAQEAGAKFGDIMSSAFEDAALSGASFGDMLDGLAEDILRLIWRTNITNPMAEAIGGINWGSIFGSFLGGFGGGGYSFGTSGGGMSSAQFAAFGFAGGGRVHPGMGAVPVGERGPELFIPDSPGRIVPNGAAGGYMGSGAPQIAIEIINQGTPQTVTQQQTTQDAAGMVVQLVVDDIGRGGRISSSLQNTYGLRRGR